MKKALLLLMPVALLAQPEFPRPDKNATIPFEDYNPKSGLVVEQHIVKRAKYPFIDVHNHQRGEMNKAALDKLVKDMDALNLQVMVNLSGSYGDRLKRTVDNMKGNYPKRFVVFANLNFEDMEAPDYSDTVARQLEQDIKNGAQGLKFFKNFGMDLRIKSGERIKIDDPRFDKAFEICAKYKVPVLIHTAEPRQFFQPWTPDNERWLELKQFPSRYRPADKYPTWETLMGELYTRIGRHKNTTFINAHLGWLGGDLGELGKLMDKYPNMLTEVGAVLAELGRQPKTARAWFTKYQDRVLFGKDTWAPEEYFTYFRVFETSDEYFDYYRKRHAFWKMYGMDLPDEVLKKLYYKNALRIIPGIDASQFPR